MTVYQTVVFTYFTTRQLNGERGGNRTRIVTVLQTAPYASIGNSPMKGDALCHGQPLAAHQILRCRFSALASSVATQCKWLFPSDSNGDKAPSEDAGLPITQGNIKMEHPAGIEPA